MSAPVGCSRAYGGCRMSGNGRRAGVLRRAQYERPGEPGAEAGPSSGWVTGPAGPRFTRRATSDVRGFWRSTVWRAEQDGRRMEQLVPRSAAEEVRDADRTRHPPHRGQQHHQCVPRRGSERGHHRRRGGVRAVPRSPRARIDGTVDRRRARARPHPRAQRPTDSPNGSAAIGTSPSRSTRRMRRWRVARCPTPRRGSGRPGSPRSPASCGSRSSAVAFEHITCARSRRSATARRSTCPGPRSSPSPRPHAGERRAPLPIAERPPDRRRVRDLRGDHRCARPEDRPVHRRCGPSARVPDPDRGHHRRPRAPRPRRSVDRWVRRPSGWCARPPPLTSRVTGSTARGRGSAGRDPRDEPGRGVGHVGEDDVGAEVGVCEALEGLGATALGHARRPVHDEILEQTPVVRRGRLHREHHTGSRRRFRSFR